MAASKLTDSPVELMLKYMSAVIILHFVVYCVADCLVVLSVCFTFFLYFSL